MGSQNVQHGWSDGAWASIRYLISFKNEQVTIKIKGQERKLNMKQGDVKIKQRTEYDC